MELQRHCKKQGQTLTNMKQVPLYTQRKGSVDCGHICLRMILSYHGVNLSYKEIKSHIKTHTIGTYTPQLGIFLQDLGFSTNIFTMNPSLFSIPDSKSNQKEVLEILTSKLNRTLKSKDKRTLSYFVDYIKKGGIVTPLIPSEEIIRSEIAEGRPLLTLLTSNFLTGIKSSFNFHFNVITGIDKTHIYVNDPLSDKRGGKQKYKISDYLYAIHASAYGDMDNACIMSIKKK